MLQRTHPTVWNRLSFRPIFYFLSLLVAPWTLHAAEPIKLSGELIKGAQVDPLSLKFSPDGKSVLYEAVYLYCVPIEGGMPVALAGPVSYHNYQFTLDGNNVIYLAAGNIIYAKGVEPKPTDHGVISVSSTGGGHRKLNHDLPPGNAIDHSYAYSLQFSSDRKHVLYMTKTANIYCVPTTEGAPVQLNETGQHVDGHNFRISPDGGRAVYAAGWGKPWSLYSVPSTGGKQVKLGEGTGFSSPDIHISPDSSRVLYLANVDNTSVLDLYSIPITGGTPTKLNGPLSKSMSVHILKDFF